MPTEIKTTVLFAVAEPMVDYCERSQIIAALERAFVEGDPKSNDYGGTPKDLLWMILRRAPNEWRDYIVELAPLFIAHDVAEKLGQGVTQSIESLDQGKFLNAQIDLWSSAWQEVGKDCDDLQIPLRCLDAAVEVIKSDSQNDRPLFRLPLEVRRLIRPLLNKSLGEVE